MQVTGIVCEFNPFHLGHAYLLSRLRQRGADAIVCAMSGNFVQRGEMALVNKLSRGEMAVSCGADLVLELPTAWAMTTAETFARGGVQLLKMAGCTHIGFGSECGDAARLRRMVLSAWLGLPKAPETVPYARVLAANETGRALLRQMRKAGAPVLTKAADVAALGSGAEALFRREAGYTDLYTLAYTDLAQAVPGRDWRLTPMMK